MYYEQYYNSIRKRNAKPVHSINLRTKKAPHGALIYKQVCICAQQNIARRKPIFLNMPTLYL